MQFVAIEDLTVKAIGACNTVLFKPHPIGLNTDYTGYIEAFKERFGDALPGAVAIAEAPARKKLSAALSRNWEQRL